MLDKYVSDNREEMILKNEGLIHSIIKTRFHITQSSPEYEDLASVGRIGLIKAIDTFDKSKGIKFATYASTCISNEIGMYFRKNNKHSLVSSFEDIVTRNETDGSELTLEDKIEDPNSDFTNDFLIKTEFVSMINTVLNFLTDTERIVMLYMSASDDWTQRQIADALGFSQSYVSRIDTKARKKIRDCMNRNSYYEKIISFSIVNNEYVFIFPISFSDDFSSFFKKVEVDNVNQQVTVRLKADLSSFFYVAEFFVEMYKTEKNTSKNKAASRNKTVSKPKPRKNSVPLVSKEEKLVRKLLFRDNSDIQEIAKYILTLDSFFTTEIKNRFSGYADITVHLSIHKLIAFDLVIRIKTGQYKVMKSNIQKYE